MTFPRGLASLLSVLALWGCAAPDSPPAEPPPTAPQAAPEAVGKTAPPPVAPPERAANEVYTSRRVLDVPLPRPRLEGKSGAELWVSPDGGRTWSNHGPLDLARPAAAWQAPGDGRFAFRVVPTVGGRRESTPTTGDLPDWTAVVDTRPPVVELLAPNGGEIFGARRATIVSWAAQDANAAPAGVVLEASSSDEEGWVVVAKDLPNTGRYHWELPATSSQAWRLRVLVRDLAGNVGQDASDKPFTVDGLAPDLKILGPKTAVQSPVTIEYQATDLGGAGLRKLALWATRDGGQTWTAAGEDEDLRSPVLFQDLDGVYGLRLSAEDRVGNAVAPPRPGTPPQATLILDRVAPEVKLLAPTAAGLLAGVPTSVRWLATDNVEMPPTGISLHFSADGGKTWSEVATALQNDGEYTWTPPKEPAVDCRLKVVAADAAGNKGESATGRFGLDGGIPEARATGPDRVGSHSAKIQYEIRNRGTAPVVQVTLWYKPENVKEWLKYGDDPDAESPMLFAKADGRYGIYATCATEAGLKAGRVQTPPDADTQPQMTVTVDATPPQITLETFAGGGYYASGASQEILWKILEENPDPRGMLIHHSPDGGASWNLVTSGADPASGKYRWVVPASPGARHKIRLSVADRFGNRGETETEKPFTIDAQVPSILVLDKPAPATRSPRVQVRYKAADATSGIEKVVLHARPANDGNAPYKPLAENRAADGTFDVQAPGEGAWAFLAVAVDGAGLMSADTGRIVRPDFVVVFDAAAPEVALKDAMLPDGTRSVLTASWEIEWTAKDDATAADRLAIRLELSTDAGRTWGVAVAKHPNSGKADLRSFLQPGKRYRARVVAVDEAGNEGEAVSSDFDPQDVPPAALSILGIEDGRSYPVGSVVTVAWTSPDKTIREASLEISTDGGRTWAPYAEMRTPSMRVTLPAKEGRYHLRATARDFTRRPIYSNAAMFDAIAGVEPVRILTHARLLPGRLAPVVIEPRHIVRTAKALRLELSSDAKTWTKAADVRSSEVSFEAPSTPGEYVLRLVVVLPDGREYDSNHARFAVGASGIELLSLRGGTTVQAGSSQLIAMRTDVEPSQVQVELSTAGGEEGTWKAVPVKDLMPTRVGLLWRVPATPTQRARLRISHRDAQGKLHADQSESDFTIDVPSAAKTPPKGPVADPGPVKPPVEPGAPRLETSLPTALKGGSTVELKWSSPDAASKVRLILMIGERAQTLVDAQPATGSWSWAVPKTDAKACAIVVEADGKSGRSATFEIDSSPPGIDGVDIEVPQR